jgi:hypothetical protein
MTETSPPPPPKPAASGSAAADPFALTLHDVHLVSSWLAPRAPGTPAGVAGAVAPAKDVAIGGMALVFDQIGITLLKPGGGVGAVLPWSELTSVTATAPARTPEGERAVLIEATAGERSHRFLVATDDPDGLRAVIGEVVGARTGTKRRGLSKRVLVLVALAVVAAAGIALALLVTVGGVKL